MKISETKTMVRIGEKTETNNGKHHQATSTVINECITSKDCYCYRHEISPLSSDLIAMRKLWKLECVPPPPPEVLLWKWCRRKTASWSCLLGTMLFVLGLISLFTGHVVSDLEWYSQIKHPWRLRSVHIHREAIDIWNSSSSKFFYGCSKRGPHFKSGVREKKSNGYLLIATSGGLNQQRTGITDAVAVARILNATLVVPELDHNSYWKDNSDFKDIFDVDWFISNLSKDVTVVRQIPDKVSRSMEKPPYTMRVPRKSNPEFYLKQVLPILLRRRALQLTKFDYRLANILDEELQKLRCRVNYHALRFTMSIQDVGQKLVRRIRNMTSRYIAVHLRFEPDMLAFSGCYYGGGEKEINELRELRRRWETLPDLRAEEERSRGKCPLTPFEVGLMLKALGFKNDSYLYLASGEIYGGEETLQPLKDLFPNLYTKDMLLGKELKPFIPFSSRLAALDYIVCDESDVFVTNNNGNMAKILAGHRRYMSHKRTIRPNSKKLSSLFKARESMDWNTFARKMKFYQRDFMGEPEDMRPGRGEFHEFPYSCICLRPQQSNESASFERYFRRQNSEGKGRFFTKENDLLDGGLDFYMLDKNTSQGVSSERRY